MSLSCTGKNSGSTKVTSQMSMEELLREWLTPRIPSLAIRAHMIMKSPKINGVDFKMLEHVEVRFVRVLVGAV